MVFIFGKNEHPFSVTLEFDAKTENLESNRRLPVTTVLDSGDEIQFLTFKIKNIVRNWDYQATYKYYKGDINAVHDDGFAYSLPFKAGESYYLAQGFNGSYSHQGDLRYSLDFQMDEGTGVYAARSGLIIEAEESHDRGGPLEQYMPFTNYISILHDDGTFADYSHLKKDGALVEVGQRVRKGQLIGYSGSTGFASGPHLHFVVKKARRGGGFVSIPIKFTTKDGVVELSEGQLYTGY